MPSARAGSSPPRGKRAGTDAAGRAGATRGRAPGEGAGKETGIRRGRGAETRSVGRRRRGRCLLDEGKAAKKGSLSEIRLGASRARRGRARFGSGRVRRRTAGRHDARAGAQGGGDSEHLSARVRGEVRAVSRDGHLGQPPSSLVSQSRERGESRVVNDESSLSHFAHMMIIMSRVVKKTFEYVCIKDALRRGERNASPPTAFAFGGARSSLPRRHASARGDRAPFARVPRGERGGGPPRHVPTAARRERPRRVARLAASAFGGRSARVPRGDDTRGRGGWVSSRGGSERAR